MISLEQGVELVWHAFRDMVGGEIYVKKIPSMKLVDIARAVAPDARHETIGIRPGEKLHEQMVGPEDALLHLTNTPTTTRSCRRSTAGAPIHAASTAAQRLAPTSSTAQTPTRSG